MEQTGRYLIYSNLFNYIDNWAKYFQRFMRQCVKPA